MHTASTSSLLLALTSNVFATFPGLNVPGAVSPNTASTVVTDLSQLRVSQAYSGQAINGAAKVVRDYQKWGREPPTPVVAQAATQTGSVQASDGAFDFVYYAPVSVGGKTLNLDFDTGSSDLWVFSKRLPASEQKGHNIYEDTGVLLKNPKEFWSINYVDGTSASGVVYGDSVAVGGATATAQAVEAATSVPPALVARAGDGFLGLAFDSINTCTPDQCYTFMHQLAPTLPQPLFTAALRHNKPGTFDFGFIDSSEYTGSIGYTPADNSSGFWGLHPTGYSIGSGAQKTFSFSTVADTGTSLLYLPPKIVSAYYGQISGSYFNSTAGLYLFPCASTVPNFSLYINGHKATVPGSYLKVGRYIGSDCLGGMQSDKGFPDSILGDSFLKSQFVVFNLDGPKLGFAQQAGIPSS